MSKDSERDCRRRGHTKKPETGLIVRMRACLILPAISCPAPSLSFPADMPGVQRHHHQASSSLVQGFITPRSTALPQNVPSIRSDYFVKRRQIAAVCRLNCVHIRTFALCSCSIPPFGRRSLGSGRVSHKKHTIWNLSINYLVSVVLIAS